ncbi:MAG: hypothetical protein JJ899_01730 [Alphaproteobacteria bacterium]|nr:hypothetical protein [Alphaproteobacteria bacterium]
MTSPHWEKFESLGEAKVRENLAHNRYGEDRKRAAEGWLDQLASARGDEFSREQIDIAREAAASARRAADEAKTANTIAKIALAIAAISAIAATVSIAA